ncbi:protein trichome berefringence-like 7 isoform X1 [Abrus precatorius]|uniref:Protein trichome berefringence-like 7 isoform X1 n=1 Tax=Abrus precatorius TaxID=3816 RepID=A0A8B8KIZ0_ABRPR|nr:protein trichome berefringence-like 7 isoform X1 [Abrus precatorius]
MSALNRSISFNRTASFNRRTLVGIPSPKVNHHNRFGCVFLKLQVIVIIGFVISFFVAVGGGYRFVLPSLSHAFFHSQALFSDRSNGSVGKCDVFDGSWVQVQGYPLYDAKECPFVEQGFDCLGNGRSDRDYLSWRWKPKSCEIPRFDVRGVLEMLRSKRVVFVGDSMSRTQWESLICMLMAGVDDKRSVYEVNQNKITKRIRFLGVRFSAFNFTIEFFRSVFLVQHGRMPKHAPKRVKSTLLLDKLDDISDHWVDSDILIFNTGHWWVPSKLFDMGCYFQVGSSLKLGMPIPAAFKIALETWASWVEKEINRNKTRIFFRTFEPSHWSDQTRRTCNVTQYPTLEINERDQTLFSDTVLEVVKNVTVPINVLHVTSMSAFRSDAHVGNWSDNPSIQDCSHWCLPGVPDMWNEIILSQLFTEYEVPFQQMESFSKFSYFLILSLTFSWEHMT